jgi:putative endonuclease
LFVIPQRSGGICFFLCFCFFFCFVFAPIDYTAIVPTRDDYEFFVYILSSRSRTLYIGVTRDLRIRVLQHREKKPGSFTARYNIHRLVYFERFQYVQNAIAREKELKDWNRARKIELIESTNPTWQDLAADT